MRLLYFMVELGFETLTLCWSFLGENIQSQGLILSPLKTTCVSVSVLKMLNCCVLSLPIPLI
jgi:hypothetical protein